MALCQPCYWMVLGHLSYTGSYTYTQNADGTKAYLHGNAGGIQSSVKPDAQLSVLDITAPGQVRLALVGAADFPRQQSSQVFGVETIAVANGKAYLGNPSPVRSANSLIVVDLSTYSVSSLTMNAPVGVAVMTKRWFLPIILR